MGICGIVSAKHTYKLLDLILSPTKTLYATLRNDAVCGKYSIRGLTRPIYTSSSLFSSLGGIQIDKKSVLKEWQNGINVDILTSDQKKVHESHTKAVQNNQEMYKDPFTTFEVFTILAHLNRGYCCGNACRHCPFKHVMVEAKYRDVKIYNTAYYS